MMISSLFLMYSTTKNYLIRREKLFIKWILKKKKETDKTKTNAKPAICKGLAKSKTQKRHPKRKLKQDTYPKKEKEKKKQDVNPNRIL